jgi:hypothetical protein
MKYAMRYRNLLLAAVFAGGIAGAATVAVDNGIAVKESDVATPNRGMTMSQVAAKFGTPVTKLAAVGKPPISRWEYPGFVVYFESNYVIDSVIGSVAPDGTTPAGDSSGSTAPNS